MKWYAKAAAQGDPTAQANLGDMYEHGTGTREDWVEAARWYAKSAARDNAGGLLWLGRAYQFGIGVPQNRKAAIEAFQKASFLGHAQARYFAQHLQSRGNFIGFREERVRRLQARQPLLLQRPGAGASVATRRYEASSVSTACGSTGFARWTSKPAARVLSRSASVP